MLHPREHQGLDNMSKQFHNFGTTLKAGEVFSVVQAQKTLTIVNKSRNYILIDICKYKCAQKGKADVLIAAVGRPEMVKQDWVKPGAVVIDVGTNRVDDPSREKGYRLVGDVDFDEVKEVAGAISPSPGGVGPMTIAMLLRNTVRAADIADKK